MAVHTPKQRSLGAAPRALLVALLSILVVITLDLAKTQAQAPTPAATPPVPIPIVASIEPYVEYVPNTALVKFKPEVALVATNGATVAANAASLNSLLQAFGATAAEPVFSDATGMTVRAARPDSAGLERIYRIQWTATIPVEHAVAALGTNPAVEYAEPDYIARPARTPNDSEYATQWALPKINAPAAWDVTTGASTVIIALIDSGVDLTHPDLADRLWQNDDPVNGVDDDLNGRVDDTHGWNVYANTKDLTDPNGHGSEVGGVAGAATDNGIGMAGMCWGCKLMFVSAMQASGIANYSDIAAAVQYAASNGAHVINLSLGGYADSAVLRDAVREAATTAVIVGGAGNDDSGNPFYPAAYPEVVAVAATDSNDQKAVFSNYGPWVDVSAPGKDIRTTTLGGYATSDGTSLAAPFVAGLAGLIRSQHPAWTPEQVRWQLLNTAVNIDGLNPTRAGQLGKGRINAGAALATAPQPRATIEGYAIDGQANARPAPGQAFQLALNLRNLWLVAQDLQGTVTSSDPYVNITDSAGAFGDIAPGQLGSNGGDPFGVTVAGNAPYNHQLQFTLNLSGAGGYSLAVPFTVQVRSAVETLGNTIYSQNTTWTSDKTYVLNGSVIVNTGVTLTIQPGTVIKGQPGKFIRVDGTLIARGTAEKPIIFANATTDSNWSGIRFTASAVDAWFDAEENYVGGSILQHVEVSQADVGVSLAGRAPYIADSRFMNSPVGVQTYADGGLGGKVRIERNDFEESSLNLNGGASVLQNGFQGLSACAINLGGGSPLIMQNKFTGTDCNIEGNVTLPAVVSNTLSGGVVRLSQLSGNYGAPAPLPLFLHGQEMKQIAAGSDHTCALLEDNSTQCWGHNYYGQLGTGDNALANTPQPVIGLAGQVSQLTAGSYHTCALIKGGIVQCWGYNDYGQLGVGNNNSYNTPQKVNGLIGAAIQIAAGTFHTCALIGNGTVQCWGQGVGTPQIVTGLPVTITGLAAGYSRTCVLNEDGSVNCWEGVVNQSITGLSGRAVQIAIGSNHTCVLIEGGSIQCWGLGDKGQLGAGNNANSDMPQTVTGLAGIATQLTAGFGHTCAALTSGRLQCWGEDNSGQLGTGNNDNVNSPYSVIGLAGSVTRIAAGSFHTCALLSNGSVQCWGQEGRLGTGSDSSANTPQHVQYGVLRILGNIVHQAGGLSLNINGDSAVELRIGYNSLNANTAPGLVLGCNRCRGEIASNTITHNQGYGISIGGAGLDQITVHNNNLVDNSEYDVYLSSSVAGTQNFTIDATNNFWNVDPSQIPNRIRDCTFDDNGCGTASSTTGKVLYDPPLADPDQTAPTFARSVTVDPDPVGMQAAAVMVDFSAPMMTATLPLMSFHDIRRGMTQQVLAATLQAMAQDMLGRVWFATNTGIDGVRMYDGRQLTTYTTANSGLGDNLISSIYGAADGDVWFAHGGGAGPGGAILSRLSGTTWITYSSAISELDSIGYVYTIGQDKQGIMWFGTGAGAYSYDGVAWHRFTTSDGLVSDQISSIVRDMTGRMWFNSFQDGLSVFDGVNWTIHSRATGLPTNLFNSLFADSKGRIWVGLYSGADDGKVLAMYDGESWHYWGPNGVLACGPSSVAEAPDGSLWFAECTTYAIYDGVNWTSGPPSNWAYSRSLFDARGNFWYQSSGLDVHWGGLDYPFVDGQWLSPTRFQASYTFDANVPSGFYTVQIDDAVGSDGIQAYASNSSSFQVDFGAGVTLDPPAPPQVTAQTNGSLGNLSAAWVSNSPNIDQYRYAIGTTPGARNIIGWTYLAATSVTRNNLNLVEGQSYYVTVQARNTSGLWSVNGISNEVVGGQAPPAGEDEDDIYLPLVIR